ncbi:MAG: phosphatase PAP2 family protein [Methylotenera sp.]|nr:phosphatase PAP2 family protein [Methylotenera sp.]
MLAIYTNSTWDVRLSNHFFNVHQQQFPLKHHPFFSELMHTGLKWLMVGIALLSLLLAIMAKRMRTLKPYQHPLLWVFVGMAVSSSVVAILKHYSLQACPWDLTMYGGDLPLLGLFSSLPAGVEAGGCFPAGHPSGGFALMAFYFAFRKIKPQFAYGMLGLSIVMGLVMGVAQVMRGAHFLSHVLWSGWVVWVVLLLLYAFWRPEKVKNTPQSVTRN